MYHQFYATIFDVRDGFNSFETGAGAAFNSRREAQRALKIAKKHQTTTQDAIFAIDFMDGEDCTETVLVDSVGFTWLMSAPPESHEYYKLYDKVYWEHCRRAHLTDEPLAPYKNIAAEVNHRWDQGERG